MASRRISSATTSRLLHSGLRRGQQLQNLSGQLARRQPWTPQQQIRLSSLAAFKPPVAANEPNHIYAKGSAERAGLTAAVERLQAKLPLEIPLVIGGKEIRTSSVGRQANPSDHKETVATYSQASPADVKAAIEAALAAQEEWAAMPFAERAAIFLKAADLIANKYRYDLMAATMLGQGKNAWQAEIDAAAELVDFLRFGVSQAEKLYAQQPEHHSPGVWNRTEYRPLEGFVYAVSPFNFTAIAGNLTGAPALLGNVVVWKPSDFAVASGWVLYNIFLEAGLPPNVIQFVPGPAAEVTREVLAHPSFAALHYTGSTAVFRQIWGQIGEATAKGRYTTYPRVVGETGGKNFHLVHASADVGNAAAQTVRGAFEFQGQKCSATSRLYAPRSLWPEIRDRIVAEVGALRQGVPWDPVNFAGPVIHADAFARLSGAIDAAKNDPELTLLVGGTYDNSKGYYIQPTVYETSNPNHPLLSRELFGPVLVTYVYDDAATGSAEQKAAAFAGACDLVNKTSEYGLTGSVFAADRKAVQMAESRLRNAAGNFYINCKSTGAVVGQQPFGGSRASGTNDKAGSATLLNRFVSVRSIKEEFGATTTVTYPSNEV